MPAQIHKDDIGTVFRLLIKDQDDAIQDISAATTKDIIFTKPTGEKLTKAGSFTTNGTDGYIQYVSVSGDLDTVAMWNLQAHIIQSGTSFKTDIYSFKVFPNL